LILLPKRLLLSAALGLVAALLAFTFHALNSYSQRPACSRRQNKDEAAAVPGPGARMRRTDAPEILSATN
jgi:hypothetical protein